MSSINDFMKDKKHLKNIELQHKYIYFFGVLFLFLFCFFMRVRGGGAARTLGSGD